MRVSQPQGAWKPAPAKAKENENVWSGPWIPFLFTPHVAQLREYRNIKLLNVYFVSGISPILIHLKYNIKYKYTLTLTDFTSHHDQTSQDPETKT